MDVEQYPIPRVRDLFHKLNKGKLFSKIDLSDAYLQIELDEESKDLTVVNTPLGLYQYQRLPFGVASVPAIFQRLIEEIINGIPGCINYLDDIICTGKSEAEHLDNLPMLFKRLKDYGLRCNFEKCTLMQESVEYLGHVICAAGIQQSEKNTEAIKNLPRPTNLAELQSFMGKVNYYCTFIKDYSTLCGPLNFLRKKNQKFVWNSAQENVFQELKKQIVDMTKLVNFDKSLPIILATDASSFGIGAVISHRYPDGSERPIAHASKTLNDAQKNYSQIEKEALSIIFGIQFTPWQEAEKPWQRIHVDYAGPFEGFMWLICVDSFSGFPYVIKMTNSTSISTIVALQNIFAIEGLPEVLVTDNGRQFVSSEFENFCKVHGIQHLTTAPLHPASNGQAERFVRTFKNAFKKQMLEGKNMQSALLAYLTSYRSAPNKTGKTPSELLHGRQHRGLLSLLKPI
ncbi:PREDICTED: uncharacterized protein K02A2.6-like [Rhagoletis zephyria]|uniref:uncharacterized protein K02A2.6-like n=1 Tax=Rhagoletis zephyria TaxID=28612 RepID=UPI0008114222|nr:PREDICTED: uncharacterized protein K02A2.6-like [Rhagoletis zephyria]